MGKKQKNYIKNGKKGLKNSSFLAPPASRKKIISKVGEGDRNAHIYPCLAVYYYFLLQTLIFVVQSCAIKKNSRSDKCGSYRAVTYSSTMHVLQYHARTMTNAVNFMDHCVQVSKQSLILLVSLSCTGLNMFLHFLKLFFSLNSLLKD